MGARRSPAAILGKEMSVFAHGGGSGPVTLRYLRDNTQSPPLLHKLHSRQDFREPSPFRRVFLTRCPDAISWPFTDEFGIIRVSDWAHSQPEPLAELDIQR